jgi:WD40 repeat protein
VTETLQQVVNSEAVSPRLLNPGVPRDLETLCLKCLEKDPEKRYATAQQLAGELIRFLQGEPIQARPVRAPERFWRWCYRKPATAASLGTIALLLLIVLIGSPIALIRINRSRDQMEKLLYVANMGRAQAGWEQNNAELVGRMLRETEAAPYHGFEWFYWQRQIHLAATTLHFRSNIIALSVSPDGRRLVSGGGGPLILWDMAAGRETRELLTLKGHTGSVFSAAFSPDGKRIISGGQDKTARIWETTTGRELRKLEGSGEIEVVAFSPDGGRVLTGGNDQKVRIWEVASGEELFTVPGNACAFSPDGQQIVTGVNNATNNAAVLWDATDGHEITRFKGHTESIMSVAYSPDGTRFVTGSRDLTAKVWDVSTRRALFTLPPHRHGINAVAFSRDGQHVATGSVDQTIRVWNANDGHLLFTLKGHTAEIEGLAFFPDGQIVSSAQDATIRFWDADGPRETLKLGGEDPQIWGIAFSPDGRRVVTGSYYGRGRMWDVPAGRELFNFRGTVIALSADGRQILSGAGKVARLLDAETGREIRKFEGHSAGLHSVAFSADGKFIVTAAVDHLAIIWEVASGKLLHRLKGHTAPVAHAFFPRTASAFLRPHAMQQRGCGVA